VNAKNRPLEDIRLENVRAISCSLSFGWWVEVICLNDWLSGSRLLFMQTHLQNERAEGVKQARTPP
jgi:hypothetical protein